MIAFDLMQTLLQRVFVRMIASTSVNSCFFLQHFWGSRLGHWPFDVVVAILLSSHDVFASR